MSWDTLTLELGGFEWLFWQILEELGSKRNHYKFVFRSNRLELRCVRFSWTLVNSLALEYLLVQINLSYIGVVAGFLEPRWVWDLWSTGLFSGAVWLGLPWETGPTAVRTRRITCTVQWVFVPAVILYLYFCQWFIAHNILSYLLFN